MLLMSVPAVRTVVSDDRRGRDKVDRKYDPEDRWPDPEQELPNVPEAPSPPSESEAPTEVAAAFWKSVLVVNYALAAVALGPMLAYFRGRTLLGAGVFLSGLFAVGYAYLIYRTFRRTRTDGTEDDPKG